MSATVPWRSVCTHELAVDPELSALVLLDAALSVTIEALHAFVPELDPQAHSWSDAPPVVLAARNVVVHARLLRSLIDRYREELHSGADDFPF